MVSVDPVVDSVGCLLQPMQSAIAATKISVRIRSSCGRVWLVCDVNASAAEAFMNAVIGRFSPQIFAIFRIMTGLMFAMHGSQKLFGWPPSGQARGGPLPPLMMAGGLIELVGGLLIAVGLATGFAAFICSGEMAVAFFMAHFPQNWNPLVNKGELAVAYCFAFLYIAAHGGGIWSLDNALRGRTTVVSASTAAARP